MHLGQTAIYLIANVFSAAFGLLNVVILTRLFAPHEYGVYVLGFGFAVTLSTFLSSWLKLLLLREQAKGDGTDVRGTVLLGFLLSCLVAPIAYPAARLAGLEADAAGIAVLLAIALGFFETCIELWRAQQQAFTLLKATTLRAVLVPLLAIAVITIGTAGVLLLMSTACAYALVALVFARSWWGAKFSFDGKRFLTYLKAGLPLTFSLTLLAISNVIDRFVINHLSGEAAAGQYAVGVDLVRQTLIIPAISAAAVFLPLAVQILASQGKEATRKHLENSFELLLVITLPACLGFAVVSPHIANIMLGPEFRETATKVMPIVSVAVVFQVLTSQYLHIGFLLSNRNSFYLWSTGSVVAFNAIVTYLWILQFGVIGAAWARLAAEVFGFAIALILTRWAFPVPLPLNRAARVLTAAIAMAIIVAVLDATLATSDTTELAIVIPVGIVSYLFLCWLLDVARSRNYVARLLFTVRSKIVKLREG